MHTERAGHPPRRRYVQFAALCSWVPDKRSALSGLTTSVLDLKFAGARVERWSELQSRKAH